MKIIRRKEALTSQNSYDSQITRFLAHIFTDKRAGLEG